MKFSLLLLSTLLALTPLTSFSQKVSTDSAIAVQDKAKLDELARDFYSQLDPLARPFAQSTLKIFRGDYPVAHGIVIGKHLVLTKFSDLHTGRGPLILADKDGKLYDSRIIKEFRNDDLALLEVPTLKLPAVNFANAPKIEEGDFLLSVRLDGKAGEFGIVSVNERSLRTQDLPYIGIIINLAYNGPGVLVDHVEPNSPADKAAIRTGDKIIQMNSKTIKGGSMSMQTALAGKHPGENIKLVVERNNTNYSTDLTLSSRKILPTFPQHRLEAMNAMGNRLSKRRDNFPSVIQTDMKISPENAGRLVVNLEGKPVGIALARAGRIESYVLPASKIQKLLSSVK